MLEQNMKGYIVWIFLFHQRNASLFRVFLSFYRIYIKGGKVSMSTSKISHSLGVL